MNERPQLLLFPAPAGALATAIAPALAQVLADLQSPASRHTYAHQTKKFCRWWDTSQWAGHPLSAAAVASYKTHITATGKAPASIRAALAVIRQLATAAAALHIITHETNAEIHQVKRPRNPGTRSGHWLTAHQVEQLIATANGPTLKDKRAAAIIALLAGSGIRRAELAALTTQHVRNVGERWVIVDLVGKGAKLRNVAIPTWAKLAVDAWANAATIQSGALFRTLRNNRANAQPIRTETIADIVAQAGRAIGLALTPHDLRRTHARLARAGGASLEQIQYGLGHASIQTTMNYLGRNQNLQDAPCDHIRIDVASTNVYARRATSQSSQPNSATPAA